MANTTKLAYGAENEKDITHQIHSPKLLSNPQEKHAYSKNNGNGSPFSNKSL